jgi:hypothetical protein
VFTNNPKARAYVPISAPAMVIVLGEHEGTVPLPNYVSNGRGERLIACKRMATAKPAALRPR